MIKDFEDEYLLSMREKGEPVRFGLFLSRFQPIHKGHIRMIEKALSECNGVLILIGSANKAGTYRNPFPASLRYELVKKALEKKPYYSRLGIDYLPDYSGETHTATFFKWGHYLYHNVMSRIYQREFTMYYCDSLDKLDGWFDTEICDWIHVALFQREQVESGISSSRIREALSHLSADDRAYLEKALPAELLPEIPMLSEVYQKVLEDPREDHSMR